jgi:hypothetical protein
MRKSVASACSLFALACAGCSSSSSSAASDGGAADAGGSLDAGALGITDASGTGDATVPSDHCGAGPWVTLGITVSALGSNGAAGAPIAGATFTSPLCPGSSATSDANGRLVGHVSQSTPFYGRFDAPSYVSMLTPEQQYASDDDAITVTMLPPLFTSLVGGYDATKGTIFIGSFSDTGHDGGTDPCDSMDGIQFAVQGHPEWTPTYYSAGSIPTATNGTSTTTSGRASFAGLDVGEPVTLTGSKPGCVVTFVHGADTGRAPREAGYVTFIGAYVTDGSDAGVADAASE